MNRWLMLTWLVGAMVQVPASAEDCQFQDRAMEAPPADESSVTVIAMSPAEGGEVSKATVIAVDVEYRIADLKAGDHFLNAIFAKAGRGGMMPGDSRDYPTLAFAAGKAHVCIPLTDVYEDSNMRWPLSMRVNLMRRDSARLFVSVASSRPFSFRASDIPSGALERQAALPEEYYDSLMKASGYFRARAVLYKICIERYPAMQPVLTRTFRAWEARHRADIDFISELQFESYRSQLKDRTHLAAGIDDRATEVTRAAYEKLSAADLRQQCDWAIEDMNPTDDLTDDAMGDEIEIVRKYAPKQAPGNGG